MAEALLIVDFQNDFTLWHPAGHGSFREQGGSWPHCVAGTEGADLHPGLDRSRGRAVVDKGQDGGSVS